MLKSYILFSLNPKPVNIRKRTNITFDTADQYQCIYILKLLTRLINLFYLSRKKTQNKKFMKQKLCQRLHEWTLNAYLTLTKVDIDVHCDNCIQIRYS